MVRVLCRDVCGGRGGGGRRNKFTFGEIIQVRGRYNLIDSDTDVPFAFILRGIMCLAVLFSQSALRSLLLGGLAGLFRSVCLLHPRVVLVCHLCVITVN